MIGQWRTGKNENKKSTYFGHILFSKAGKFIDTPSNITIMWRNKNLHGELVWRMSCLGIKTINWGIMTKPCVTGNNQSTTYIVYQS